jgi:hypothetical protein
MLLKMYVRYFLVADYLICVVPGICAAPGDLDLQRLRTHFESVIPAETNLSELNYVKINELAHYACVFGGSALREKAFFYQDKDSQVRALFLGFVQRLRSLPYNLWGLSVNRQFHTTFFFS